MNVYLLTITDINSSNCVCISWASSCRAQPLCWASLAALDSELSAVIIRKASGAALMAFLGQVILLLASRKSASIMDLAAPPGRNSYCWKYLHIILASRTHIIQSTDKMYKLCYFLCPRTRWSDDILLTGPELQKTKHNGESWRRPMPRGMPKLRDILEK